MYNYGNLPVGKAMETMVRIFAVAGGGALGAVARYLINISPIAHVFQKFPLATFLINVSGSFAIGFLMVLFADKVPVSEEMRLAIIVGFLGAFTTFSTFEMEIYGLVEERQFLMALGYLVLSVVVGFIGVAAGVMLARKF